MTISTDDHTSLADHQVGLLWGAWVELGVSGWQRTHEDWAIDPEPLIIATAGIGDRDPRLRDEALDWCIANSRYVSRTRLKNLLRNEPDEIRKEWGPFAATVTEYSGVAEWPGATEPFRYRVTGRSTFDSMEQPSRAWVRLRGMFGLGARTEIIRFFLSGRRRASVAVIAESVGYAKRNVADECDALARAGVLRTQQTANRFYYSLARRDALTDFVGDIAPIRPDWSILLAVTNDLVALEKASGQLTHSALMVEAHRVGSAIEDDLEDLGIDDRPTRTSRDNYWPSMRAFAQRYLGAWATGVWAPSDHGAMRSSRRPASASPRRQQRNDAEANL